MDNFIDRASYAKVNLDTSRKPAAAIEFSEDVEQSKYRCSKCKIFAQISCGN
jgi:hypothetical protein